MRYNPLVSDGDIKALEGQYSYIVSELAIHIKESMEQNIALSSVQKLRVESLLQSVTTFRHNDVVKEKALIKKAVTDGIELM